MHQEIFLENIHATSVEFNGKAVLIKGHAGSGKSSLALKLITLGASLIADDRTIMFLENQRVFLCAPSTLPKGLEVRGIGIVKVPVCLRAELALVVDLSKCESERFPDPKEKKIEIMGYSFPFYFFQGTSEPAGSIYALIKFGLIEI